MKEGLGTWTILTPDRSVRSLTYSFGPGRSNTLAVRGDDGAWVVLSPASGVPTDVLDALAEEGPVRALVAPNGFHHLGQAAWRARFPQATSFAPAGAFPRLAEKSPGIEYRPLEELTTTLPPRIEMLVPDGLKVPDLMMRVSTGPGDSGRTVWWMGDLFSNNGARDQIWPLRILARLVGSGPGYRRNARPGLVYVRDAASWLGSVRRAVTAHPPSVVVPAHGSPVLDDTARRTREIVDAP